MPTSNWYYSPNTNELYHYDKGVWEAYPAKGTSTKHFHTNHSLKVIPDKPCEVEVRHSKWKGYQIVVSGQNLLTWHHVTECDEIESHLLPWNKHHLQQVATEESPPVSTT